MYVPLLLRHIQENNKPVLPGFLSHNVVKVLVENFSIAGISTVEVDLKLFMA